MACFDIAPRHGPVSSTFPTDRVIALGNFDGVHRGHQAVIQAATELAREMRRECLVACFYPHPRYVLGPSQSFFELTPFARKEELFRKAGAAGTIALPFDDALSRMSPEEFCGWLWQTTRPSAIVLGCNFHFGFRRAGGPAFLREYAQRVGTAVRLVDQSRDSEFEAISSERIRTFLSAGDIDGAHDLLGYPYCVQAKVIHGAKLGRTLGFPTANMELPQGKGLRAGIYAVRFHDASGRGYDAVASFGRRPTVAMDGAPLLETFVFDYAGDLYDQTCTVTFVKHLRPEVKFDSIENLVAQMKRDEDGARTALAEFGRGFRSDVYAFHRSGASTPALARLSEGEGR